MPAEDKINRVSAEEQVARYFREALKLKLAGLKDDDVTVQRDGADAFLIKLSDNVTNGRGLARLKKVEIDPYSKTAVEVAKLIGGEYATQPAAGMMGGANFRVEANLTDIAIDIGQRRGTGG